MPFPPHTGRRLFCFYHRCICRDSGATVGQGEQKFGEGHNFDLRVTFDKHMLSSISLQHVSLSMFKIF